MRAYKCFVKYRGANGYKGVIRHMGASGHMGVNGILAPEGVRFHITPVGVWTRTTSEDVLLKVGLP